MWAIVKSPYMGVEAGIGGVCWILTPAVSAAGGGTVTLKG